MATSAELLNVATAAELTVGGVILHALAVFDFDVKLGTFQHVENNVKPYLDIALALSAGAQEPLDLPPGEVLSPNSRLTMCLRGGGVRSFEKRTR